MTKTKDTFEQFFQGDVCIIKIPESYKLPELEAEIPPENFKVRLLEGELTGHHHEIDLLDRPETKEGTGGSPRFTDAKLNKMFLDEKTKAPTARMFKATNVANQLVRDKVILRADLAVGLLKIENGPMRVQHPEHGSIMLAPGNYYVGRQIESVAGEERAVSD